MGAVTQEHVDRMNMALSEIGLPEGVVLDDTFGYRRPSAFDSEVVWRAREVAKTADLYVCRACFDAGRSRNEANVTAARNGCEATRPFMDDCGVQR